jgi:hypothetical protein
MAKLKATPDSQTCARLLDGAEDELRSIRAAFACVSLEAESKKKAAEEARSIEPLRPKPADERLSLPVENAAPSSCRPTLMERLKTAAKV